MSNEEKLLLSIVRKHPGITYPDLLTELRKVMLLDGVDVITIVLALKKRQLITGDAYGYKPVPEMVTE